MKQFTIRKNTTFTRVCAFIATLAILPLLLLSFTVASRYADDFLKQLGISKTEANTKISHGILGGSFDEYGLQNARKILTGNRAAMVKAVIEYTKKQVATEGFLKQYNEMRLGNKPQLNVMRTPEEMQKDMIAQAKKSISETEASIKKADASLKPTFEKLLVDIQKQLKEAESFTSKPLINYRKNYAAGIKITEDGNQRLIAAWEAKYPANHMQFVKMRLLQFLDETNGIDFNAELFEKGGKKYYANRAYESKGSRWKMGFRAGKEAVETGRAMVEQWIAEIN